MPSAEDELYITPILTPICALDATEAFNGLALPCACPLARRVDQMHARACSPPAAGVADSLEQARLTRTRG